LNIGFRLGVTAQDDRAPPAGTPLSKRGSLVEGNPEWVSATTRFSPWLVIAGHDHLTPIRSGRWYHRIGQTTCVNVGLTDKGPLHYCLVEAEFTSANRAFQRGCSDGLSLAGNRLASHR
jgi:hypothetical protein